MSAQLINKAIDIIEEQSPTSTYALLVGLTAAAVELDGRIPDELDAYLARAEELSIEYVTFLPESLFG